MELCTYLILTVICFAHIHTHTNHTSVNLLVCEGVCAYAFDFLTSAFVRIFSDIALYTHSVGPCTIRSIRPFHWASGERSAPCGALQKVDGYCNKVNYCCVNITKYFLYYTLVTTFSPLPTPATTASLWSLTKLVISYQQRAISHTQQAIVPSNVSGTCTKTHIHTQMHPQMSA